MNGNGSLRRASRRRRPEPDGDSDDEEDSNPAMVATRTRRANNKTTTQAPELIEVDDDSSRSSGSMKEPEEDPLATPIVPTKRASRRSHGRMNRQSVEVDDEIMVLSSEDDDEVQIMTHNTQVENGNGMTNGSSRASSVEKLASKEVPKKPSAATLKSQKMAEFRQAVLDNLRTKIGTHAVAQDESHILCVCGKSMKLCNPFHWKYLIQKAQLKNGKVIQKGHWFNCATVREQGSLIPIPTFTEEEIEASKETNRDSPEEISDSEQEPESGLKRRKTRTQVFSCSDEPPAKRIRDLTRLNESGKNEDDGDNALDEEEEDVNEEESEEDVDEKPDEEPQKESLSKTSEFSMERHIRNLMATRVPNETFLQDGPCFQMSFDLPNCHMCKYMPIQERKDLLMQGNFDDEECDISCCFYAFRKLKMTKSGNLIVAGYLDPHKDPTEKDMKIWQGQPLEQGEKPKMSLDKVRYTLGLIGDQFCDLVQQEKKCLSNIVTSTDGAQTRPVWKPAVKGVREMCDVCKTTLFNNHWTCGKCGFYVCLDCHHFRKSGLVKDAGALKRKDTDDYDWPMCCNNEPHQTEKLLLAQIIPKDALADLGRRVHEARLQHNITQYCHRSEEMAAGSCKVSIF